MNPGASFLRPFWLLNHPAVVSQPCRTLERLVSYPGEPFRISRPELAPPTLTPLYRWPTRRSLTGSAWLRSSPNASPGLHQGLGLLGFRAVTLLPWWPVPSGSGSLCRVRRERILSHCLQSVNRLVGNPHRKLIFPQQIARCSQADPQHVVLR